mmetsp:Transcript_94510/g.262949  ORF Transcript_94510/g.262949 Transcript_94510/m.262949 type:complete len:263 (+) Transcript_94510:2204-2992(+)
MPPCVPKLHRPRSGKRPPASRWQRPSRLLPRRAALRRRPAPNCEQCRKNLQARGQLARVCAARWQRWRLYHSSCRTRSMPPARRNCGCAPSCRSSRRRWPAARPCVSTCARSWGLQGRRRRRLVSGQRLPIARQPRRNKLRSVHVPSWRSRLRQPLSWVPPTLRFAQTQRLQGSGRTRPTSAQPVLRRLWPSFARPRRRHGPNSARGRRSQRRQWPRARPRRPRQPWQQRRPARPRTGPRRARQLLSRHRQSAGLRPRRRPG